MKPLLVLIFLLTTALLFSGCILPKNLAIQFQKAQEYGYYQHRYVYFDPAFPAHEQELLRRSLSIWSNATEGYLRWTIRPWPENYWEADLREPEELEGECSNHLLIFRQHSDDEVVFNIETRIGRAISGYANGTKRPCGTESILLVSDRLVTPLEYKQITMHEIGHILGMHHDADGHISENAKSIMSYDWIRRVDGPTDYDLAWLLKINDIYHQR